MTPFTDNATHRRAGLAAIVVSLGSLCHSVMIQGGANAWWDPYALWAASFAGMWGAFMVSDKTWRETASFLLFMTILIGPLALVTWMLQPSPLVGMLALVAWLGYLLVGMFKRQAQDESFRSVLVLVAWPVLR